MAYEIIIKSSAQQELDSLPDKEVLRISRHINQLAVNPRPVGTQKLSNEEGCRLRIGKYRVLYMIDDKAQEIHIYRVKHRKEAYR